MDTRLVRGDRYRVSSKYATLMHIFKEPALTHIDWRFTLLFQNLKARIYLSDSPIAGSEKKVDLRLLILTFKFQSVSRDIIMGDGKG